MEFIGLIFSSFWHFVGFALLLIIFFSSVNDIINRILRQKVLMKYGPPEGCDADGKFKEETIKEE